LQIDRPLKIYFDLSQQEKWHQEEWKKIFSPENVNGQKEVLPVSKKSQADCILKTRSRESVHSEGEIIEDPAEAKPVVVWDSEDFPLGTDPGLYCSLPRPLYEPRRHASFCYPIVYNECVQHFSQKYANFLFCFAGGITSGLRNRLVQWLNSTKFEDQIVSRVKNGPWEQMFDRSGLQTKKEYAEILQQSKFVLCPRGNGVGSIRFFEVLKAGRVPVILSDDYVLPKGIDWNTCTIRIKEQKFRNIPLILRDHLDQWPGMSSRAAEVSKKYFEGSGLLANLGKNIKEIMQNKTEQSILHKIRVKSYLWNVKTRQKIGKNAKKIFGLNFKKKKH
jgi:hypothetical protein